MKNYWVLVFVLSLGFVIGTFIKLLDTDIKDSWILIIGFILVAFLQSFNYLPLYLVDTFKIICKIFLLLAMCSIGLKVSFKSIGNKGGKIFLATFFAFMLQVFIVIHIVT